MICFGEAAPIFWAGANWVTELTATIDVRPNDHLLVRVEYRHDQSDGELYFERSGSAHGQDTLTMGATSWF